MKKFILFLIFILAAQVSFRITPVLAANEEDATVIKKVIGNYLEGLAKQDLALTINQISTKYSGFDGKGKAVDYDKLKSNIGESFKRFTKTSISGSKIISLDIKGNDATAEIEYKVKGFDTGLGKDISSSQRRIISLVKEKGGSWKIVGLRISNLR